jgi:hypothetical protein
MNCMKKLVLAALLVVAAWFSTGRAQNFVNGSFELWGTASCDINTAPDSWANYSNGGLGPDEARFPGCPSTIPNAAQSGAAYARYYAQDPTAGEGQSQTVTGFTIGTAYQVRYYYCGSNLYGGTGNNSVHILLNGVDVHQSPVFASSLSTWTLGTYNFTATAASNLFGFRMYSPSGGSTGSGALDNLSVGVALAAEELEFFAAAAGEREVELTWRTKQEIDLDHFTVERMLEGGIWEDVMDHAAAGNTQVSQEYVLRDTPGFAGKCYYRLRQIDKNGGFAVSEVRAVQVGGDMEFTISPNPADGQIQVLGLAAQPTSVVVLDAMGREFACAMNHSLNALEVMTADLKNGVYFLSIQMNGARVTKRFLVARD